MPTPRHRQHLPQLDGGLFVTDGGLETDLIFHDGFELPAFAAFPLLDDSRGRAALRRYYGRYVAIARRHGAGLVLESPTWRASAAWGAETGYDAAALARVNVDAIALLEELREEAGPGAPVVLSGCVGPRDDGYVATRRGIEDARDYHRAQVEAFAATAADLVTGITMTHEEEAVGLALAARDAGLPAAISFTVETDGRLPSGQPLGEAIEAVDAQAPGAVAHFGINCAHPTHFADVLAEAGPWRERIRAVRANASTLSHAELDEATELDEGDPADLAARYRALRPLLPELTVLGGCCGTDHRHVEAVCAAWVRPQGAAGTAADA